MPKRSLSIMIILLLWANSGAMARGAENTEQAVEAATQWLALIDQGQYSRSWQTAAVYFKAALTLAQWEQSLEAARKPLGKLITRKLKSARYMTSLPGAPDGHYVVITFETSFENKASAVESVTPMKDPDGQWRVSGYYIK